ncbi:MAG: rhomboid family intramembrane serine protease [Gammaproteobacteria bacterium]
MIPIRDDIPCNTVPYVAWGLMSINIVIFLAMLIMPDFMTQKFMYLYGMVSARYTHPEWALHNGFPDDAYFSFFSSMFLHGGWLHIIMNMLFMWIFADNIEDRLGHARFFLFYVFCGLLAAVSQYYFLPESVVPMVGASGAIAGVMGAYFLLYPYARIVVWVPFFVPLFFEIPAIGFLGLWVIIQLQEATTAIQGEQLEYANVAWWAHIGGFIAGAFLHQVFLKQEKKVNSED